MLNHLKTTCTAATLLLSSFAASTAFAKERLDIQSA